MIYPCTVLVKTSPKDYELENGTKGTSYKIIVLQGEDVNTIACDKESVYDKVEVGKNYTLLSEVNATTFDGKPNLRIKMTGILNEKPENVEKLLNLVTKGNPS